MPGMSVSFLVSVGVGWLLAGAPARADRIVPCTPDTPDWIAARDALSAFDQQLEALPDDGSVAPVRTAMTSLLGLRCFAIARQEETRPPVAWDDETDVSALALKVWWRTGGEDFFASHLELGAPGSHNIVIPPDLREVLTREHDPKHRLADLLCPANAGACGVETEPWRLRAERAFRPESLRRSGTFRDKPTPPLDCMAVAQKKPSRLRYVAWRGCMGGIQGPRTFLSVLPLGRIRAPMDGWLVVRGRRGHYRFCDQMDAYHLGTGTAYRSSSCSRLALNPRGEVDGAGTDAARQGEVKVGRLAPDRLRELTWMLLFEPEVRNNVQVEALYAPVPKGLSIEWPTKDGWSEGGGLGGAIGGDSGQTVLRWTWFPHGGAEPLSGTWTFPWSWAVGEDHADILLEEAESAFQEECPALALPVRLLDYTREPDVNAIDAPSGVAHVQDARLEALRSWRPPPGCVPGKNGG